MYDCSSGKLIKEYNPNKPFILTLKQSNQPVTGVVYVMHEGKLTWETDYLDGLKHGIEIRYTLKGTPWVKSLWEKGRIKQRKRFKDGEWIIFDKENKGIIPSHPDFE